jgi:hypothetical protein
MFGQQNGEHSQRMGWARERPREWEPASTAKFAQVIASILESHDEQTELLR